jgi:nucleolar MIF4G domain-containing protein 1
LSILLVKSNVWVSGYEISSSSESENNSVTDNSKNIKKLKKDTKNNNKKKQNSDDDESIDDFSGSEFDDIYDNMDDDDFEDAADEFFDSPPPSKKHNKKSEKIVKFSDQNQVKELEEDDEDEFDEENEDDEDEGLFDDKSYSENSEDEEEEDDSVDDKETAEIKKKNLKEDIYGRLIDQEGNLVKTEKYVPPAQRLKHLLEQSTNEKSVKLMKLSKQLNGLLNRLATSNINSIANQIMQMFYSNEHTRYDMIETINNLLNSSLMKTSCITPIRLIIEHAALIHVLTANVGIELGATLLQKLCNQINSCLSESSPFQIENKILDNLLLFLCNLFNFKLISSNLIVDLFKNYLIEKLSSDNFELLEKLVDLVLIILRSVGFLLRKDNPAELKEIILKVQTNINTIKLKLDQDNQSKNSEVINSRLKFMMESINAIKNNDIRRLDAYDTQPIELLKKQTKLLVKQDQSHNLLNVTYKDLINANELGRWWIVGSAWNVKENNKENEDLGGEDKELFNRALSSSQEGNTSGSKKSDSLFSEKILKLAKEQHMNTDVRKAVFCIILSAEVI